MAKGKLTADFVKAAGVGRHGDGGGLYLSVKSATSRNWVMRYMIDGRSREMGLGAAATVSLTEARARAAKARVDLDDGIDPLGERLPTTEQRKRDANAGITFRDLTTDYLAIHEGDWKNAKHKWQWRRSLEQYAFPVIGNKGVGEIDVLRLAANSQANMVHKVGNGAAGPYANRTHPVFGDSSQVALPAKPRRLVG